MQLTDLTRRRERWVEANRENGFEEGITHLLTELYPDNAHFIYELLQNAEDAGADAVGFTLSNEALHFEHNGKRLFNLKDVESITSIGVSNKRNDPTNIGKFGVGFKAVFAYTNTPEIHSGEFHFRIKNLVVPESLDNTHNDGITVFHFPFDNPRKDSAKAVKEIERGLNGLADNTLLFLNHIREIEYRLPSSRSGKMERIDEKDQAVGQHIEIHSDQSGESKTVSNWLRYSKIVEVTDEAGNAKPCHVAIAFRLIAQPAILASEKVDVNKSNKNATKSNTEWTIISCEPGQVSIFFPADKETSNLRFHLHAPFASTVARDSVRDCESNTELCKALGQLTAEAMADIRERGLLTISFLAVLPNKDDGLPELYKQIREAIVARFQEEDLLPTKAGSHAKSSTLYSGPSEISSVIDDSDLSFLTGYGPPLWAANAPQRGQREDKFLQSLEIKEWEWNELQNIIDANHGNEKLKKKFENWLSLKSDMWLMRFYALMESCHSATQKNYNTPSLFFSWQYISGIRVIDNNNVIEHVRPHMAYFPHIEINAENNPQVEMPSSIRLVKPEVYDIGKLADSTRKAAREFLRRIGVRIYDERAEIDRRLAFYKESINQSISEHHYDDIRFFIAYLLRNPNDANLFHEIAFLFVLAATEEIACLAMPGEICLDAPYEPTGLNELEAIHHLKRLFPGYLEHLCNVITCEEFASFLKKVGVHYQLAVSKTDCTSNAQIKVTPGERVTITGCSIDWTIVNLETYLLNIKHSSSRLIWAALIQADNQVSSAYYQQNQKRNKNVAESQLVQQLKSFSWIPDKDGAFYKPHEITQEMLPKEFPYDDRNGLLTAIGFGVAAQVLKEGIRVKDEDARKIGFDSVSDVQEALELLKAKREGRIQMIANDFLNKQEKTQYNAQGVAQIEATGSDGMNLLNKEGDVGRAHPSDGFESPALQSHDVRKRLSPVLQRINNHVGKSSARSERLNTGIKQNDQSQDDDDYLPAPVDYSGRIARAEQRNATEIDRLEREEELLNKANGLPRYSYGWFLALLELECMASSEKNSDGKTISISFRKIASDMESPRTIILSEPSRFIPQSVEELSGLRVDLYFGDGHISQLHVDSFTAKEFSLHGKLKSTDELFGVDLCNVVEACIDVQNPSFLLQALLERYIQLRLDENFDMKANLRTGIEFIFGPPGTGKTTHLAEKVLIPMMRAKEAAKVLVLTPTNKAADVLTIRIMEKMSADTCYKHWLIRFGTCSDARIEAAGVWRDRSFDISSLGKSVTVTTIARFAYDGFTTETAKLHEMDWDTIVIDEASMIPLVNIIYPLYNRMPRKFIVAGDPFQIEPIVAVEQWKNENIYTLIGLDKAGSFAHPTTEPHNYQVTNLETQYRSIPTIGELFSCFTYNGVLKHHRPAQSQRPLIIDGISLMPVTIIKFPVSKYESIYRAKRLKSGTSYQTYSALFTFEFVRWLAEQMQKNHAEDPVFTIGIIAPYRAQANLLIKFIDSWETKPSCVKIQVGTIHGFQGDECDIVIVVLNPPPSITSNQQMFLNKQNILNVAISRARDYLLILIPDEHTEDVQNLHKVTRMEWLVKSKGAFIEYSSHAIEAVIWGNPHFLEENTFSTGHQMVNVYVKPERYYEVRSDDSAIDVQIHDKKVEPGLRPVAEPKAPPLVD